MWEFELIYSEFISSLHAQLFAPIQYIENTWMRHFCYLVCPHIRTSLECVRSWANLFSHLSVLRMRRIFLHASSSVLLASVCADASKWRCEKLSWVTFWFHMSTDESPFVPIQIIENTWMRHFSVLTFLRICHVFCFSMFLCMRHLLFSVCALTSLGCVRSWADLPFDCTYLCMCHL